MSGLILVGSWSVVRCFVVCVRGFGGCESWLFAELLHVCAEAKDTPEPWKGLGCVGIGCWLSVGPLVAVSSRVLCAGLLHACALTKDTTEPWMICGSWMLVVGVSVVRCCFVGVRGCVLVARCFLHVWIVYWAAARMRLD